MAFKLLIILVLLLLIPSTQAHNNEIILFSGSSYHYNNESMAIIFHDTDTKISNPNNRYVEFWTIYKGELVSRDICYNYDYCYLKGIKININTIFFGKEAVAVFFNVVDVL